MQYRFILVNVDHGWANTELDMHMAWSNNIYEFIQKANAFSLTSLFFGSQD